MAQTRLGKGRIGRYWKQSIRELKERDEQLRVYDDALRKRQAGIERIKEMETHLLMKTERWRIKLAIERRKIRGEKRLIRMELSRSKILFGRVGAAPVKSFLTEGEIRRRQSIDRKLDEEFARLREEWGGMDRWMTETERLEHELHRIREKWGELGRKHLGLMGLKKD